MKRVLRVLTAVVIGVSSILGNITTVGAEGGKTVIALDPGHDARHGGACAGGLQEQDLTLKIAYYCKNELEKYDDIEVYMTRTSAACPYPHTSSSPQCIRQRMLGAESAGADFYVSLHLNAEARGTSTRGAEVIYPNNSWKPEVGIRGKELAQYIQSQLVGLGLYNRGIYYKNTTIHERYPDGSTSDYYTVQIAGKESGIPNVIVENAFLTNAADRNHFLSTEDGLKKLGVANANAIAKMLGKHVGWELRDGQWYYYSGGVMRTGWINLSGSWYYLNSDGAMQTGWEYVNDIWYYMNGSGVMQTGWQYVNGGWYYMNASGAMLTGWQYINGRWYYLHESGFMLTGWQYIDDKWYYMDASGAMQTGWQYVRGSWYYMDASGAMLTGWQLIGGTWYYMDESGAMVTGWKMIDDIWYYFTSSGAMLANRWVGNYYLQADGSMATNRWIDSYWVGSDGLWIPNYKITDEGAV